MESESLISYRFPSTIMCGGDTVVFVHTGNVCHTIVSAEA